MVENRHDYALVDALSEEERRRCVPGVMNCHLPGICRFEVTFISSQSADAPIGRPLGWHQTKSRSSTPATHAGDTVHREFQEEIGQALARVRLARVLENIFQWGGGTQHEIVFIFTAAFASETAYEISEQAIADDRGRARVIWRTPEAVSPPLYPVGVAHMVAQGGTS